MDNMLELDHYPKLTFGIRGAQDTATLDLADQRDLRTELPRPRTIPSSKGCILLVDDDSSVRETLAELLDDVGFHAMQAADAAQALIILRRDEAIDVLVTDLTMPGDDGISLIRQARAIRNDLPAVLLTGYAEQVTAISTIAGGNYHVLRKPVGSDQLVRQIEVLVGKINN